MTTQVLMPPLAGESWGGSWLLRFRVRLSRNIPVTPDTPDKPYLYEPVERFGEGLTTQRPWNKGALAAVELLNGRVAMLGFLAALIGEAASGKGIVGQLGALVRLLLG